MGTLTLTLQPDAAAGVDTYVYEGAADSAYSTNTYLEIRGWAGVRSHGLLRFDLSELAGMEITSATLYLYGTGGGSPGNLLMRRILSANSGWTEGATWNYANGSSVRWAGDAGSDGGSDAGCSVSGTDYSATQMGSMAFDKTAGAENSAALDLTEFAAMVAANHGMIIKDTGAATSKQPGSSDNGTAGRRPKLVVEYEAPGTVDAPSAEATFAADAPTGYSDVSLQLASAPLAMFFTVPPEITTTAASILRIPYDTAADLDSITPLQRELLYDTTNDEVRYGDGVTPGGIVLAKKGGAAHDAVTLAADADGILSLSTQEIGLDTQSANTVLAGPTSGAAADPAFRALVAADLPAGAGTGDMLWSVIQAMQCANEVMNWPANVGIDIDLVAANQWWDSVGTPSTAATMVDVAGEAGITETYEYAMKCVADAASEGLYQRFTYADQPRVKAGRKLSAIAAVWVGTAGRTVTMKLVTSNPTEVSATATAQAWTIIVCENLTLDGTYVDLQFTVDGADTFYVAPLGVNVGTKALALAPRGLRYVHIENPPLIKTLTGIGDEDTFTDIDVTANSSNLAARAHCHVRLVEFTDDFVFCIRRNGSTQAKGDNLKVSETYHTGGAVANAEFNVVLDDGQIFEYNLDRTGGEGNLDAGLIHLRGFWEWA